MHDLLAEDGSFFLHCDWRVVDVLKIVLKDIYGTNNFLNQIIWHYYNIAPSSKRFFAKNHDVILWFSKNINQQTFKIDVLRQPYAKGSAYAKSGWSKDSKYSPNPEGKLMDDVWDLPTINNMSHERVGYATQKPEKLIQRIIIGCSKEDDLVADFFCGSGTTAAVAEKLNRKWIVADLGRFAIHTTRKRMINIQRH